MRKRISILLALGVCGGCGASVGSNADGSGILDCQTVQKQVGLDDKSELGFSAADILSFSERSFSAPLTWSEQNALTVSPMATDEDLTIAIAHTSDHADALESMRCGSSLKIAVDLSASSSEGSLQFKMPAVLSASSTDNAGTTVPLAADALHGLELSPTAKGWRVGGLSLEVHFKAGIPSARLAAKTERDAGGEAPTSVDPGLASGEVGVATWQ